MRKIALWITYLYMLCCPLEFMLNSLYGSSVKFIALAAVAAMAVYFIIDHKAVIKIGISQVCIIGWAVLETVSVLWTDVSAVTYTKLMAYLLMAAFVILLSIFPFEEKELDNLIMFYSLGGVILSLLVLIMGRMDGGVNLTGRLTFYFFGRYQDPNGLAALVLGGAFYSLSKIFTRKKLALLYALAFGIQSAAIFYTGSRGGLLAYILGIFIFAVVKMPKKHRLWAVVGCLLTVTSGYFVLKLVMPTALFDRLFDLSQYVGDGGSGRLSTWSIAMRQILKSPVFGNGIVSYLNFFLYQKGDATAMHNTFLCVIFEVGFVGFILFIIPYLKSIKSALINKNACIISIIIVNLAAAFFLDALYLRYIWNALIFGMIAANIAEKKNLTIKNETTDKTRITK